MSRVLVIAEDEVAGQAMKRALASMGHTVTLSGRVPTGQGDFEIIVADLDSGLAQLHEARQRWASSEAVAVGEALSAEMLREIEALGVTLFIEKPVVADRLIKAVRNAEARLDAKKRNTIVGSVCDYVVSNPAGVTSHENGLWHRVLEDGRVEVGVDIRQWLARGQMPCLDILARTRVEEGVPFARIALSDGRSLELVSPLEGTVLEVNPRPNETVCTLAPECVSEDWMLWLVRVAPAQKHAE